MNIQQLIQHASTQLIGITDTPRLDAELLLAHVLKKSRTFLYTWPQQEIDTASVNAFENFLTQRISGNPLAYITGEREFWSLKLHVTIDTLIPRPETELLVEHALRILPKSEINIADLGTGSGAIALALASERPLWHITATDQSTAAINVARSNAQQLAIKNSTFITGNWFEPLNNQHFHAIISNPPYIPANDIHLAQGDVRFEPATALSSGIDGLDAIRHIAQHAGNHLSSGGLLMIEHGYDQKSAVKEIFERNQFINIEQLHDLNENPRVTLGYKKYA